MFSDSNERENIETSIFDLPPSNFKMADESQDPTGSSLELMTKQCASPQLQVHLDAIKESLAVLSERAVILPALEDIIAAYKDTVCSPSFVLWSYIDNSRGTQVFLL